MSFLIKEKESNIFSSGCLCLHVFACDKFRNKHDCLKQIWHILLCLKKNLYCSYQKKKKKSETISVSSWINRVPHQMNSKLWKIISHSNHSVCSIPGDRRCPHSIEMVNFKDFCSSEIFAVSFALVTYKPLIVTEIRFSYAIVFSSFFWCFLSNTNLLDKSIAVG